MVERIRDSLVAEEIAAQAGTEGTPPLHLNQGLTPVIFGPQRPPLAASGYFPGILGFNVAAVALNASQIGLFVSGTNTDTIVRVNRITIMNEIAAQEYHIRRLDDVSGFSAVAAVPGYINAGNPNSGGVFSISRSNTVGAGGTFMASLVVNDSSLEHFDGPWILNNGGIIVTPSTVNRAMRAVFHYEAWPAIRRQPIGG